jgi:hypothetical protein
MLLKIETKTYPVNLKQIDYFEFIGLKLLINYRSQPSQVIQFSDEKQISEARTQLELGFINLFK